MKKSTKKTAKGMFGLTKLPAVSTKADYAARAKQIERKLKSKGLSQKERTKMQEYLKGVQVRAGLRAGPKKVKSVKFNPNQAFLPDFLKSVDMVRIEEIIADRVFNQLRDTLSVSQNRTKKIKAA